MVVAGSGSKARGRHQGKAQGGGTQGTVCRQGKVNAQQPNHRRNGRKVQAQPTGRKEVGAR